MAGTASHPKGWAKSVSAGVRRDLHGFVTARPMHALFHRSIVIPRAETSATESLQSARARSCSRKPYRRHQPLATAWEGASIWTVEPPVSRHGGAVYCGKTCKV
jgi:hypothetical protein